VSALFKAYFTDAHDIGDPDVLIDIAKSVEMDADVVKRLLDSDEDLKLIQDRDKHSRKMGINSVPTFIIANQHAVPGAQPPELWAQVIADLAAQADAP
jgi:predicted DsbA family dithiol-disulfide isomerase